MRLLAKSRSSPAPPLGYVRYWQSIFRQQQKLSMCEIFPLAVTDTTRTKKMFRAVAV